MFNDTTPIYIILIQVMYSDVLYPMMKYIQKVLKATYDYKRLGDDYNVIETFWY